MRIRNNCAVVPVEVPGVVGVAANGNLLLKSFYSSYGVGVTDVIAPGGDSILQRDGRGAQRPRPLDVSGRRSLPPYT